MLLGFHNLTHGHGVLPSFLLLLIASPMEHLSSPVFRRSISTYSLIGLSCQPSPTIAMKAIVMLAAFSLASTMVVPLADCAILSGRSACSEKLALNFIPPPILKDALQSKPNARI